MHNRHTYWATKKLYRWLARQPPCAGDVVVTCSVGSTHWAVQPRVCTHLC